MGQYTARLAITFVSSIKILETSFCPVRVLLNEKSVTKSGAVNVWVAQGGTISMSIEGVVRV